MIIYLEFGSVKCVNANFIKGLLPDQFNLVLSNHYGMFNTFLKAYIVQDGKKDLPVMQRLGCDPGFQKIPWRIPSILATEIP